MVRGRVRKEFLWSAPVWQADLDAFAELRSTTILRLLQEAATRASASAGFDADYYERIACMWIVRRTRLELFSPARYGDVLTVRTWIADFRRVRSQREYELRAADRLVAQAASDWVFVDRAHGRPRRIPPEWEATFGVGDAIGSLRDRFADMPPPTRSLVLARRIELHDLDALRHVNNSNYVAYLEQAFDDLVGAAGWGMDAQLAAGGRLRPVEHDLEYLDAALYGETIGVTTWITELSDDVISQHTLLHRGDPHRPLLQGHSRYRWTSHDGAPMPIALRSTLQPT